jgi:hypothetical protein
MMASHLGLHTRLVQAQLSALGSVRREKMGDLGKLFAEFKGCRGASAAAIAECERHFRREFPKDYRDFLMIINGGEGFIGASSYLRLWEIEELPLMNDLALRMRLS